MASFDAWALAGNPFDIVVAGERARPEVNNLGVDTDTYALDIDVFSGTLPLRAAAEIDGIHVAASGATVDLLV